MAGDIIPFNERHFLDYSASFLSDRGATLEAIIGAWLHEKFSKRSQSIKTHTAYRDTVTAFRVFLQERGRDLLWRGEDFIPTIADAAQLFADTRSVQSRRKGTVAPATQNQRLAILSSFYAFVVKRRHLLAGNPIEYVDRPSVEAYVQAVALEQEEVEMRLRAINTSTLQGARDIALLSVLLSTGRRVSEVAALRVQHVQTSGKHIKLTFTRTKGNKSKRDTLAQPVSRLLRIWLEAFYKRPLSDIPEDAPIWVNVHHEKHYGEPLGYHGVSGVCSHYLGTTKVHVTRHTLAVLMELAGAKLTDIQQQLGHKNAATTGTYLQRLTQDRNPYAEKVSRLLGLEEEE